MKQTIVSLTST